MRSAAAASRPGRHEVLKKKDGYKRTPSGPHRPVAICDLVRRNKIGPGGLRYKAASASTNAAVAEETWRPARRDRRKSVRPVCRLKQGLSPRSCASGLIVGAIVAVNAVGDIIDPMTGDVVAGARNPDGKLADARKVIRSGGQAAPPRPGENTTIGVVATNARLTKTQVSRMASMADDGLARALYPSHTLSDGDTVFALATGGWNGNADVSIVGALAADAMSEAIVRAAVTAKSAGGLPAAVDIGSVPARFK